MSTPKTRPDGSESSQSSDSRRSRLRRFVAPASALTGVALLVDAARAAGESRERAGPVAALGSLLLGIWFREWRAAGGPRPPDPVARDGLSAESARRWASTDLESETPDIGDADGQFDAGTQEE